MKGELLFSYVLGLKRGRVQGTRYVDVAGDITCTDDGEGNITITEEENNG